MQIHVVSWFIRVSRPEHPTGWDRGRKAHLCATGANQHWRELCAVADAVVTVEGPPRLRECRALQHVELRLYETGPPTAALVASLIDDAWAEPIGARGHDAHRDEDRTPWATSCRILLHWRPSPLEDDHA